MFLDKFLYGVDLDEEQARQNDLDKQLAALNKKELESGSWDVEQFNTAEANRQAGAITNVQDDVHAAFSEGLQEGYELTTGGIKRTLAAPFTFTFAAIPWQLWLAAAVALFIYMGGGVYLRGIIKR
jgi:hypothetical protein